MKTMVLSSWMSTLIILSGTIRLCSERRNKWARRQILAADCVMVVSVAQASSMAITLNNTGYNSL